MVEIIVGYLLGKGASKESAEREILEKLKKAHKKGMTIKQFIEEYEWEEDEPEEEDEEEWEEPLPTRLLGKIRSEAKTILILRLHKFETTNGEVTGIGHPTEYGWAFKWMLGERLDYEKDRAEIICKIARLLWKREKREYWRKKLRGESGSDEKGSEAGNV